jgi:UDP-N-acetylmuramoylalanine--D-glutamate ligase
MIAVSAFKGQRVAVFGLGGSGLAVAQALIKGEAEVVAWDDNTAGVEKARLAGVPVADLSEIDWHGIAALVLSPGVPLTHPQPHWSVELARKHGVPVIGDMELFARERAAVAPSAPLIAITGTNGKSTTTALIAHLVEVCGRKSALGGNIGTPVLQLPPPSNETTHVLEISSYQMDLAPSLNASVGILLNLSEDHLDRHGTMENYAAIKERLVAQVMPTTGVAVVGVDDPFCQSIADRLEQKGVRVERISVKAPVCQGMYADDSRLMRVEAGKEEFFTNLDGIGSLRGAHNAQNAAAASVALLALGVEGDAVREGLRSFSGLVHRMEQVGRLDNVLFVNDSKATNSDAAARALGSFDNIYWIAGGRAKTGGIGALAGFFPRIACAYLIGEAASEFGATLDGRVPFITCGTLDVAVQHAAKDAAASGDEAVVLLSPACASFDQYPNFEVRGNAFRVAVKALMDAG